MRSPRTGGFAHVVLLLIIAVVVIGGGATLASSDLAYSAQSTLAAVTGAFDTKPRVEITRAPNTPVGNIWPRTTSGNTIAIFDIASKNIKTATDVSNIAVIYKLDSTAPTSLQRRGFYMGYQSCPTSASCTWVEVPVGSVVKSGSGYVVTTASNAKISVPANQSVRLYVGNTSYYGVTYSLPTARNVGVSANIGGQIRALTGAKAVVPVNATLAYGNVLKVLHGYGYGYGYNDYYEDGKLDYNDITWLRDIVLDSPNKWCSTFKICDVNTDGQINSVDIGIVRSRAGANAIPPRPEVIR